MRLSDNFYLEEFLVTEHDRIAEQFVPSQEVVTNLQDLCLEILQPLRDIINMPVIITSGYRCKSVNTLVGGDNNSQHLYGMAADIVIPFTTLGEIFQVQERVSDKLLTDKVSGFSPGRSRMNACLWGIIQENFVFDQVILDPRNSTSRQWVHVSYARGKNRKMILS